MRVLIIEDQENLAKLIRDGLMVESYAADYVLDGESGQNRIELAHDDYDIVIMDVMMPKKDGIEVCRNIRSKNIMIPVLMLTAKDSAEDIIKGLDAGADDYLTKPFSFEILLARLRAILRRPAASLPSELKVRDIILNPQNKQVRRGAKEVKLTLKEFGLLECLMRHPNHVLNREQILANVWDFSFDSFSNVVDVHMTNLRKKLKDDGKILETVRGVGYRINA